MTISPLRTAEDTPAVDLTDEAAVLTGIRIDDPTAVMLLSTAPEHDRADLAVRLVSVGAQGMASMGLGIDLSAIDDRVGSIVTTVTDEAERSITGLIEESRRSLGAQFDPDQRSSMLARALAEFTAWRDGFIERLDPAVEGSTATDLLDRLGRMVGPGGEMEARLTAALDLDADESSLSQLRSTVESGFAELRRDLAAGIAAGEARREEAERGTAHGLDFEDVVEGHLRSWAASRQGCMVERTSATTGTLTASSKVGDFVVTLPDRRRIVVEAKRHATIGLTGSGGILTELDAAMANRQADIAVCIAGRDAFPAEVGRFNVYGDRILAVDEGDGTMVAVAMQWAAATDPPGADGVDLGAVADRLGRIRAAAERLSGMRKTVTSLKSSLDGLHESLGDLRSDILDQVNDLDRAVS